LAGCLLLLAGKAGSFLIVEAPQPADAIVVLAGETDIRPRRALELLRQGYGKWIVLDVPTNAKLYGFTEIELAEKYVQQLNAPAIVCPIDGLSTKDESRDVGKCLRAQGATRVLIVTSDFHTRRALEIFRRELPAYTYSVAAARNEEQYGGQWWKHRQWAKVCLDEWMKLIWWNAVDRWS
jgi:uncharacterized SAM-binding protein YcdF (DUF218 family)